MADVDTGDTLLAALDIGGTKIGWALGDSSGRVLANGKMDTDHERPPEVLLKEALGQLGRLAEDRGSGKPPSLGVACPGPFLQPEGRFLEVPNLPRWQGFELKAFLHEHWPGPATAMNDANAAVLAERLWGAARGCNNAILLTMSTGMGAGLLIDGRLVEGSLGFAGEVGHIRLAQEGPVGFGKHGSVEGFLSGPGMVQVARAEVLRHEQLGLANTISPGELSPRSICEAAKMGNPVATAAVDQCARRLGELCAMLVDLLNPDVIVLGTIGSAFPELFIPTAQEVIDREAIPHSAEHVRLAPSGLEDRGNQSALAAAIPRSEIRLDG